MIKECEAFWFPFVLGVIIPLVLYILLLVILSKYAFPKINRMYNGLKDTYKRREDANAMKLERIRLRLGLDDVIIEHIHSQSHDSLDLIHLE